MHTEVNRPAIKAPRRSDKLAPVITQTSGYLYHEDMTSAPKEYVFVFGSNLAGFHGAGAALAAYKFYGAALGVGEGPTGRSYAIPTKDHSIETLPLEEVVKAVKRFIMYTHANPDKLFFVTRVGCGLAGFTDDEIAPLFHGAINCSFAQEWAEYLEA